MSGAYSELTPTQLFPKSFILDVWLGSEYAFKMFISTFKYLTKNLCFFRAGIGYLR